MHTFFWNWTCEIALRRAPRLDYPRLKSRQTMNENKQTCWSKRNGNCNTHRGGASARARARARAKNVKCSKVKAFLNDCGLCAACDICADRKYSSIICIKCKMPDTRANKTQWNFACIYFKSVFHLLNALRDRFICSSWFGQPQKRWSTPKSMKWNFAFAIERFDYIYN